MADTNTPSNGRAAASAYSLLSNQPSGDTRMTPREYFIFFGAGMCGGVLLAVLFAVRLFMGFPVP